MNRLRVNDGGLACTGAVCVPVERRELLAWALYDFANSGYTTVVLTTIFSAYFVAVVVGGVEGISAGTATLLWTLSVGIANFAVLVSAPVLGAVADHLAAKKKFLLATTVGCVGATMLLSLVGPGDIVPAAVLLIFSAICFTAGESLIAAFLPEIAPEHKMGRISGYGWSLGYFGGLLTLGICLVYITWARARGRQETEFIPVTLLITAAVFAVASLPTFLWLRERALPVPLGHGISYIRAGFERLRFTLAQAARFKDLIRFLLCLTMFQAGVSTVVVVAAIYAREVMGFSTKDLVMLIMLVNVTAAVGAFLFGFLQDRLGSVRVLAISLIVWVAAVLLTYLAEQRSELWIAANLMGFAMGSSQSGGRALIGRFTPPERSGEFFGLWGLVNRLAAIIGPLCYGLLSYLSGDLRLALLSTLGFFIAGLLLLVRVNEARGRAAARGETAV